MWMGKHRTAADSGQTNGPPRRGARKVSFALVALALIASLSAILAGALITFNFTKSRESALATGDEVLRHIGAKIFERTSAVFTPLLALADTVVLLPDIDKLPTLAPHPVTPFLISAIENHPQIRSAYLGYANGDFIMVSSLRGAQDPMRKVTGAPENAALAIQVLRKLDDGRRLAYWTFWDRDHRLVGSKPPSDDIYDPRKRPWYFDASAASHTVITDYYMYYTSGEVGVTIANRFDGDTPGVFGIDLDLSRVANFLDEQLRTELSEHMNRGTESLAALFTKQGRIVALGQREKPAEKPASFEHTRDLMSIADSKNEILKKLYGKLAAENFPIPAGFSFHVGDKDYIGRVSPIPEQYGRDTILVVAVPTEAFLSPYLAVRDNALLISILLVLAFVPVILECVRRISRPLRQLTHSAAQINKFELEEPISVASNIREVDELSETMRNMKSTLTTFSKYVPKSLVRNIVQSKLVPEIGGERRDISVMFSDIQDFTPLSQELEPEILMEKMSVYLREMVDIILSNNGVVDKFVGDSIMSYWNAPEPNPRHIEDACIAALRCKVWSNAMNATWEADGEVPLYTRFGLHAGSSIVGNIGSADRMDYTVMGAPINLGARLESLNKFYQTQILVSEAVADACREKMLFRHLDHALPKGSLEPIRLFELVGVLPGLSDLQPEITASTDQIERCRRWLGVLALYEARDWPATIETIHSFLKEFPDDKIAPVYRGRARKHMAMPPPDDWDGVEVFLTKR